MKKTISNTQSRDCLKIIRQQLAHQQFLDGTAANVLLTLEECISKNLFNQLMESLRGFSSDMQLEIADNLIDFYFGNVMHTTGISHVDRLISELYMKIDHEITKL